MVKAAPVSYKKLIVYQRMMELVLLAYELTRLLPDDERYGLTSQMRRAVVSVISNFVEGYLKRSWKEKRLYLERSQTLLHELETQADICFHLSYWSESHLSKFSDKAGEVGYLLSRYTGKVVSNSS